MRALILAAGRGSRVGARTQNRPKCLVEIAGRPLLDLQHSALRGAGIDDLAIVRGYRAEDLALPGFTTFDNPRWAETNMVSSLLSADAWLRDAPCIVSYSDIFYPAETVTRLIATDGDIAITYDPDWLSLWSRRFADPMADAESFRRWPDGRLREIGAKGGTATAIEGQYMGLLKFTPPGWRAIKLYLNTRGSAEIDRLDMTSLLNGLLQTGVEIHTVATAAGWGEVDTETDLELYQELVDAGLLRLP